MRNWQNLLIGALIAALTIGLYWPVHRYEFIALDDPDYVTANLHVKGGLSVEAVKWSLLNHHSSNWHPLTWVSHMLDCQLFGMDAGRHHLVNIGWHAVDAVLLFIWLNALTGFRWRSALVAVLFAVHPMHVESVAWVSERKDVLSTFFLLLTLMTYARFSKLQSANSMASASKWRWFVLSLFFYACGLMSKPMLVTLPFLLLLLDLWPSQRFSLFQWNSKLWRVVVEKVPFFALTLGSCALTIWAQSKAMATIDEIPLVPRLANAVTAYLSYIKMAFFPHNMAIFYPFKVPAEEQVFLAALVLLSCLGFALIKIKTRPYLLVGLLWFLGTLVPVIGLVQVGAQSLADRYTYIPYIGLFISVIWYVADAVSQLKHQKIVLGFAAVFVVGIFTQITSRQLSYWENDKTLFKHVVEATEGNFLALTALGNMLSADKEYSKAAEYLAAATQAAPTYSPGWLGLAIAQEGLGQNEEAEKNYRQALELDPLNAESYNGYGGSLFEHGKFTEAEANLRKSIGLNPDLVQARLNLVLALRAQGKFDEAIKECERVLQLDPTSDKACSCLADLLMLLGKADEAISYYRRALQFDPKSADARIGLGLALADKHEFAEAEALFKVVIDSKKQAKAFDGLGYVLILQNKTEEGKSKFKEAAKLDPKYALAHLHLAMCLIKQSEVQEAIAEYHKTLALDGTMPLALNNLAWILASNPEAQVRNGNEAVDLAERACKLTNYQQPFFMGTLAAAYAEAGRFPDAIRTAEAACVAAKKFNLQFVVDRNEQLLQFYRTNRAYHEQFSE